ncbi:hypothetical protein KGP36_06135 [Patescibacteria group bacterium]|nr:hypothetical protein [Patescibacteria group bacterium]
MEKRNRRRNNPSYPQKTSAYNSKRYSENPEKFKKISKEYRRSHPYHGLLNTARRRAEINDLPFSIDDKWLSSVWTGRCALTGLEFKTSDNAHGPFSPSIDRVIPELGYTPENCRFILFGLNALKGTGTDADMMIIAKALMERHD